MLAFIMRTLLYQKVGCASVYRDPNVYRENFGEHINDYVEPINKSGGFIDEVGWVGI